MILYDRLQQHGNTGGGVNEEVKGLRHWANGNLEATVARPLLHVEVARCKFFSKINCSGMTITTNLCRRPGGFCSGIAHGLGIGTGCWF